MKWCVLLSLLCFLFFSPVVWSQELSSSKSEETCCDKLQQVEKLCKELLTTLEEQKKTLMPGLRQQIQQKQRIEELLNELTEAKKSVEISTAEVEKSRVRYKKLLIRINEWEAQLKESLKSLDAAMTSAMGLELEKEILWAADGVIGVGLIIYGLATGDVPLIVTGGAMALAASVHFVFDIF